MSFKPNKSQAEVIDVLAHIAVMKDIDKNVTGFSGIFDHYINNSLTPRQRGIYQVLQDRIKGVRKDMAAMAKQDKENA